VPPNTLPTRRLRPFFCPARESLLHPEHTSTMLRA
jgi:hypothetical protein